MNTRETLAKIRRTYRAKRRALTEDYQNQLRLIAGQEDQALTKAEDTLNMPFDGVEQVVGILYDRRTKVTEADILYYSTRFHAPKDQLTKALVAKGIYFPETTSKD